MEQEGETYEKYPMMNREDFHTAAAREYRRCTWVRMYRYASMQKLMQRNHKEFADKLLGIVAMREAPP